MELTTVGTIAASGVRTIKAASDNIGVSAGQSLIIETSPGGAEILNAVVPAGKSWSVTVEVNVIETDV
jgi:hypothetical protein